MTFWGRTGFIYSFMIQNYILMERWNFFTKCVLFQLQNSHRIELKYWTNKIFFERKWLHTKIHKLASWCKMHLVQFHIKLTSCISDSIGNIKCHQKLYEMHFDIVFFVQKILSFRSIFWAYPEWFHCWKWHSKKSLKYHFLFNVTN